MTRKSQSHVRILIYRTYIIRSYAKFSVVSLHRLNDVWVPRRLIAEKTVVSPMSLLLLLSTVTCALRRLNRLVQKMLSLNWRTSKTLLRYEWKNWIAPYKECKTVLECGLHAVDSGLELASRIPIVSGIPDFFSCVPDSFTWGELYVIDAVSRNEPCTSLSVLSNHKLTRG